MRLFIVHYHFRPGGIRRVIELAAPHLVRHSPTPITAVTLAAGEALDARWNESFRCALPGVAVHFAIEPALGYFAEQTADRSRLRRQLRRFLNGLLRPGDDTVVWAHNLGIARNVLLGAELARACARHGARLVAHHHDWWFDNRWQRWPEIRQCGVRTLDAVARRTIVPGALVKHAAINRADTALLRRHLGNAAAWLPNPAGPLRAPRRTALARARTWLNEVLGADNPPVWIFPCRLLRRKNIAEALLLTRWLRPGAWLVTTGGASSSDEAAYARVLAQAAHNEGWPLRLGILEAAVDDSPGIPELMGVSEAVLLTSIQEGFGLPYLEAAAARRPLVARALPNISPDLRRFGFRFPYLFSQLLIDPVLFEWEAERVRQAGLFRAWRERLPRACRSRAGQPLLLTARLPRPFPFHRLTLEAQLEVLRHDPRHSWELCLPLNPFLADWRRRARGRRLAAAHWPAAATRWLSGPAYAARFFRMLRARSSAPVTPAVARAVQDALVRSRLDSAQLYPLLWERNLRLPSSS